MENSLRKEIIKMSASKRDLICKSKLARKHALSRQTIYNHIDRINQIENGEVVVKKLLKDKWKWIIDEKNDGTTTAMAIYRFIVDKHEYTHSYALVRDYVRECNANRIKNKEAFIFQIYETPGVSFQVDWKESMVIKTKDGTINKFDILAVASPYSKVRYFEFCLDKKLDTLLRGLTRAFMFFGGVPESLIFDNMKTVVQSINYFDNSKVLTEGIIDFAHNFGFRIKTCAVAKGNQKATVWNWKQVFRYNEGI